MKADYIFTNGEIHTVDENDSIVDSIAVIGDRIAAVGNDAKNLKGDCTKIIDLEGRSIVPGFIDAHLHMGVLGINLLSIDCRYPYVKSIEDIKEKIREKAKGLPPGVWIRGWGYDHLKLKEKRHPNRWDLDEAAPNNPVILTRTCSHISVHNSKSLELAGITEDTESPEGGVIERDDGKINGVMKENAHMNIVSFSEPTEEELRKGIKTANDLLISQGITGVHDSGGYGPMQMHVMEKMTEKNELDVDIYNMLFSFNNNLEFINSYIDKGYDEAQRETVLNIGPVKIMIDGSSSGPTAATLEPYTSDPGFSGIMSMEQDDIDDIILRAHKAGFQVTCHAVGDKAVKAILEAIEKALEKYPKKNHRHRIEHCGMVSDELVERIKNNQVVPIPQPVFLYEFGDGYMINYGKERTEHMFTCRTFFDEGIICAGSSDCPITFSEPLLGIHLAVNRETFTGQKISQKEKITKTQALRMFTYNSAYAAFEENEKGSLEPGKKANFVVLSDSYEKCADSDIKNLIVECTVKDGKIIYRS